MAGSMIRRSWAGGLATLLVFGVAWIDGSVSAMQRPPYVVCLDMMVLNAKYVVVGSIVRIDGPSQVIVAVERRLKGSGISDTTQARIDVPLATLENWKVRGSRLLIANGVSAGPESAIDLSAPDLAVLTASMNVLRDAGRVIQAAQDAIDRHPGVYGINWSRRTVPVEAAQMLPRLTDVPCRFNAWTMACLSTEVPADETLEQWALMALKSTVVWERAEAAIALRHFPSEGNIERLRALLDDPGLHPEDGGSIYLVRKSAYESLSAMGIKIPEPAWRR